MQNGKLSIRQDTRARGAASSGSRASAPASSVSGDTTLTD
jgi:hypothetical protein